MKPTTIKKYSKMQYDYKSYLKQGYRHAFIIENYLEPKYFMSFESIEKALRVELLKVVNPS